MTTFRLGRSCTNQLKKFAGNLPFQAFGSEDWGQDVSMPWQGEYAKRI